MSLPKLAISLFLFSAFIFPKEKWITYELDDNLNLALPEEFERSQKSNGEIVVKASCATGDIYISRMPFAEQFDAQETEAFFYGYLDGLRLMDSAVVAHKNFLKINAVEVMAIEMIAPENRVVEYRCFIFKSYLYTISFKELQKARSIKDRKRLFSSLRIGS